MRHCWERVAPFPPLSLHPTISSLLLLSFHPYEQAVEEGAPLILGDPLDLCVAEAGIQGFDGSQGLGTHLIGVRPDTHLETHLGLVTAVRTGVPESGGRE